MTVPSVNSNAANTNTDTVSGSNSAADSFTNPASTLNQANFLQLLAAQIQYQDPMNPQSDTDMAAQLAQFSSLQESTQSASSLAMMQANNLVGDTVTVQADSSTTATGVVTGVTVSNGTPEITVNNTNYTLSQVTSVTPPAASSTSSGGGTSGSTNP